jgi:peptide/nickel transport system permease protein
VRPAAPPAYDPRTRSVLDALLWRLVESRESTYSRPLAYVGFTKESVEVDGQLQRVAPRLKFGGAHLKDPATEWAGDVLRARWPAWPGGAVVAVLLSAAAGGGLARARRSVRRPPGATCRQGAARCPGACAGHLRCCRCWAWPALRWPGPTT